MSRGQDFASRMADVDALRDEMLKRFKVAIEAHFCAEKVDIELIQEADVFVLELKIRLRGREMFTRCVSYLTGVPSPYSVSGDTNGENEVTARDPDSV